MDWLSDRLPLAGLRVLDWSVFWAGPYLSVMLHDLGAEVVKLESPSSWDPLRTVIDVNRGVRGKEKIHDLDDRLNLNQHFNEWNRDKLGLALEVSDERGREVLHRLVSKCDIFVENRRPRVKDKLKIRYEDLIEFRPDLIYVSLSGFGQTPPERDAMALGSPVEVASGLFSLNGYLNDTTPAKTGFSYGDPVGALTAASVVLMALRRRRRTGKGGYWDVALRDALSFGSGDAFTDWSMNQERRPFRGNRHPVYAPQGVYKTLGDDDWVAVSVRDDRDWQALGEVMGKPDWHADSRFASAEGRREHHDELDELIAGWFAKQIARDAEMRLQAAGVPAGTAVDFRQLLRDPQLNARGMFREVYHPSFGTEVRANSIWERGQLAPRIGRAPRFGEHNREVLTRIAGLSEEEVAELERAGLVSDRIQAGADWR